MEQNLSLITLGGGCFWCLDPVFSELKGVERVECGYSNGMTFSPTYEQVCSGKTGHAEVLRVWFDESRVTLQALLQVFFSVHDPTTKNRQGNDVGTQYRSGIYVQNEAQRQIALAVIDELNDSGTLQGLVVTEVAFEDSYASAEAEHQRYFEQHPHQGYCAFVIAPKLEKFRKTWAALKTEN